MAPYEPVVDRRDAARLAGVDHGVAGAQEFGDGELPGVQDGQQLVGEVEAAPVEVVDQDDPR